MQSEGTAHSAVFFNSVLEMLTRASQYGNDGGEGNYLGCTNELPLTIAKRNVTDELITQKYAYS